MLFVSLCYVFCVLALWQAERVRIRTTGPDLLCMFWVLFSIQLLIPGAVITAIAGIVGSGISTDVYFFDRVLRDISIVEPTLTLLMSLLFILAVYAFWAASLEFLPRSQLSRLRYSNILIRVSPARWMATMMLGLSGMWVLLETLGGGLVGYQNLILLRADLIDKTFVTANLFSQTQTFAICSTLGLFCFFGRGRRLGFWFAACCLVIFGVLGVSRRSLAVPLFLAYFVLVLDNKRFYLFRFIFPCLLLFLPVLMYGKELLAYMASSPELDVGGFEVTASALAGLLRAACDVGVSLVESWATLLYLDLPYRLGVDHLLSFVRRFPEGLFGLDIEFPERIVRTSTEAFVGAEQDIPPGLFGQMWLDFGLIAPALWGMAFGSALGFLHVLYDHTRKRRDATAVFVIVVFVLALPLNSGSLDFVASVDVFLLVVLLYLVISIRTTAARRIALEGGQYLART